MKSEVEQFIEDWGQTTEEICANLDYDVEDSDDLLIDDYFYINDVWIPKISSMYTKAEQRIADKLRDE